MERDEIRRALGEMLGWQLSIYNLSFVYIGMLFAKSVTLRTFLLISISFFSARSAALLMNRYIGREIDLKNKKKSEMASLKIPKNALLAGFFAFSIIFVSSTYLLNKLAFTLSPVVLLLFIIDPRLKKHSSHRHFMIGTIESLDVIAGYVGALGSFPAIPGIYILMFGMIFIGAGFDIMYATIHRDFDKKYGLKTYAVKFGMRKALGISFYFHIVAAISLLAFAFLTRSYMIVGGAVIGAALLVTQHVGIGIDGNIDMFKRIMEYNTLLAVVLLLSVLITRFA